MERALDVLDHVRSDTALFLGHTTPRNGATDSFSLATDAANVAHA